MENLTPSLTIPDPGPFLTLGYVVRRLKIMRSQFSDKRLPPYAVCTVCGHYAYSIMEIYQRCSQVVDKKRCKGRYGPALMREDWKECPDCGRTGRVATGKCGQCDGVGWLYVNSHPKPKQKDQTVQPDLFQNLETGPKSNRGKG